MVYLKKNMNLNQCTIDLNLSWKEAKISEIL